jgi:antitoxin component YwqK of YwqJK toxin-antitoxin module
MSSEIKEIFDEHGNKIGEAEYVNGVPNGLCRLWYANGQLHLDAQMKNGEYDGPYCSYWENGQAKEKGTYSKGTKVGVFSWFDQSGELIQKHSFPENS